MKKTTILILIILILLLFSGCIAYEIKDANIQLKWNIYENHIYKRTQEIVSIGDKALYKEISNILYNDSKTTIKDFIAKTNKDPVYQVISDDIFTTSSNGLDFVNIIKEVKLKNNTSTLGKILSSIGTSIIGSKNYESNMNFFGDFTKLDSDAFFNLQIGYEIPKEKVFKGLEYQFRSLKKKDIEEQFDNENIIIEPINEINNNKVTRIFKLKDGDSYAEIEFKAGGSYIVKSTKNSLIQFELFIESGAIGRKVFNISKGKYEYIEYYMLNSINILGSELKFVTKVLVNNNKNN